MQKITPFLWFDNNAEEAVQFYTSIFKNSKTTGVTHYPEEVADTFPQEKCFSIPGISFREQAVNC